MKYIYNSSNLIEKGRVHIFKISYDLFDEDNCYCALSGKFVFMFIYSNVITFFLKIFNVSYFIMFFLINIVAITSKNTSPPSPLPLPPTYTHSYHPLEWQKNTSIILLDCLCVQIVISGLMNM